MEAHNQKVRRPDRAIAACRAVGLALAAVMVVLQPGLRDSLGLAGNSDYRAILGSEPAPGAGLRGLEKDAHATDAGTRSATAATVKPGDPAAHPVRVEAKPLADTTPAPSGTSDGTAKDTSGRLQAGAAQNRVEAPRTGKRRQPALPP